MNLKAYQKQLKKETLLNAALTSLRWTGLAIVICAIVWWCCGFGLIWIIPIIVAMCFITIFIIEFIHRLPILKEVARRIDELGLEERVATAVELKDDDSYIAKRQREDTEKALRDLNSSALKVRVRVIAIIIAIIAAICACGFAAVSVLAYKGVIPTLPQMAVTKIL